MDKKYLKQELEYRLAELKQRYKTLCHGVDDMGLVIKPGSLQVRRANTKKDLELCTLIYELIIGVELSKDAISGFEKLVIPMERHRRLVK